MNRRPRGGVLQTIGLSIIIAAPKGLIVFDTGRHKEHAQQVLDFAREQNRPIAAIINSHWHLDHVGGNPRLRAEFPGIRVYASSAIDAARSGFSCCPDRPYQRAFVPRASPWREPPA